MKNYFLDEFLKGRDIPFFIEQTRVNTDVHVHTHSFSELVVISSGTGTQIIDDIAYCVVPGDVYVLSGSVSHGFKDVNKLVLYNMMYYPESILDNMSYYKAMSGFQTLFVLEPYYRKEQNFASKLHLTNENFEFADALLQKILGECFSGENGSTELSNAYFSSLVGFLSRIYSRDTAHFKGKLLHLAEVIVYLEQSFIEDIQIQELSARAAMSARHFSRIFRDNYRTSPMEYIINLRLQYARKLLSREDLSITEIALKSGFSDSNYFARLFKKRFGKTPSEYKKR